MHPSLRLLVWGTLACIIIALIGEWYCRRARKKYIEQRNQRWLEEEQNKEHESEDDSQ